MSEIKKIGFFGDSFCATTDYPGSTDHDTYIKKLSYHYNAKIVYTGHGGSSIYDMFLIQLKKYLEYEIPDVCVLVWSSPDRLFHRNVRNINFRSATTEDKHRYFFKEKSEEVDYVWNAAKEYYTHLADLEVINLQYVSVLKYIDEVFLPTIKDKTKIIHLFSFDNYKFKFTTGVQINPPLINLSQAVRDDADGIPNHIGKTYKNQLLFETMREAIDNYEDGKVLTYTIDKERIQNEQTTI